MSWLDDTLGKILDNGVEVEGLGGLNFIGFTITPDTENMRINIAVSGAATASDDVSNESSVSGSSVSDALDTLGGQHTADAAAITALTITGAGKLPYVSGTPGTYSASTFTTDGIDLISVRSMRFNAAGIGGGFLRTGTPVQASGGCVLWRCANEAGTANDMITWDAASVDELVVGNWVAVATWSAGIKTGGKFRVVSNASEILTVNATGITSTGLGTFVGIAAGGAVSGVTTLNGARVAAPVEGTALTDADQTLTVAGGNDYTQTTALTASRTKTLGTSGSPETGEVITIKRFTTAAFTMPIVNGGAGAGTLYTFPAAGKRVADFRYDGTNWVFLGCKRLA